MGTTYKVVAFYNGFCKLPIEVYSGRSFIKTIYYLIKFRIKYPIVDVTVRDGYENCEKCKHEGLLCRKELESTYTE